MTVSSSFPQTNLFSSHIVSDMQRSVIVMLNLLTSYALQYKISFLMIHKPVLSRPLLNLEILSDISQSLLANVQLFWDENLSIPF